MSKKTPSVELALASLILVLSAVSSRGDTLSRSLESALSEAGSGQYLKAIETLTGAEMILWGRMTEMTTRRDLLVKKEPLSFGAYDPRPNNLFRPGETIIVYAEPVGYTIQESEGRYRFALTADFNLLDGKGQVLGGQRDFGRWERVSHTPATDFMLFITYDSTELAPGNYAIETLINDTNSSRSVKLITPVIIEE